MSCKLFVYGQRVEVQRAPGEPWEPAAYSSVPDDMPGWHRVRLVAPRYVTDRGYDCEPNRPGATETHWCIVPARRIRPVDAR